MHPEVPVTTVNDLEPVFPGEDAPNPAGGPERFGVVLVEDPWIPSGETQAALVAAGFVCRVASPWELAPGGEAPGPSDWESEERLADRPALAALETAVQGLAGHEDVLGDGVAVVGLGRAGTLAFLCGCTSRAVAAVVSCGGRALYPALSPTKPTQPLELLLNLDRPLLALCGSSDPLCPPEHRDLWRQKLEAGGKDHELVVYPDPAPADLTVDPERFQRVVDFLASRL